MTSNRVHQLSNGLYVSGAPDSYKDKLPTMTSTAMPYTGGDIKKSGELGKMFDIAVEPARLKKSGPLQGNTVVASAVRSSGGRMTANTMNVPFKSPMSKSGPQGLSAPSHGATRQGSYGSCSGPLSGHGDIANSKSKNSGQLSSGTGRPGMVRQNSGPLAPNLPATGLITSGSISSGHLSASRKNSGPLDGHGLPGKLSGSIKNHAINNLTNGQNHPFTRTFPRVVLWTIVPLLVIGFVAGGFILGAVQNAVLLIMVVCLLCAILMLLAWNVWVGEAAITGFLANYADVNLNQAKDGQYVKITGVVTCGNVPLETSYQRVPRCVYTCTGLYEYRGFKAKPVAQKHRSFSWELRHLERRATDFYISDFQSGLRALVKAGYDAHVTPYVEDSTVMDITKSADDIPQSFISWLANHNLSCNDSVMRLKEGYIKEGFTVTVLGVVQRNENVLMIVPPSEPVSTACQWSRCLLPATIEGLVLTCEGASKAEVIPV